MGENVSICTIIMFNGFLCIFTIFSKNRNFATFAFSIEDFAYLMISQLELYELFIERKHN